MKWASARAGVVGAIDRVTAGRPRCALRRLRRATSEFWIGPRSGSMIEARSAVFLGRMDAAGERAGLHELGHEARMVDVGVR